MSDAAAAQLRRVLDLIPRLADDQEHTIDEVATAAGVERKALIADLFSISERFDVPGGFVEGVTILFEDDTVQVHANHFLRPMRLTMPELCALELGLTMLRRERTPAEQVPIDRAIARLREAISQVPMNDRYEGTRYGDLADAGSAAFLGAVRSAIGKRKKLALRYRAGGASESTTREICPHSLRFAEQMWYVVATVDDGALRFYRLDRIEDVQLLDGGFEPDAEVSAKVQQAGRAFVSDTTRTMTVRYGSRIARWVAEREGQALAEDGSLTIRHPVADDSWAIRHVLQYGPDAELLEPADLRAALAERLASM